ncbi:hypothetical protein [Hallella absiana]|uniref:hypothetical protein n=1 Tax=Hallella absiana TaxID=2925336 RepID=UPI0021CA6A51|nr:hypothetical protein [Hallella absiana]
MDFRVRVRACSQIASVVKYVFYVFLSQKKKYVFYVFLSKKKKYVLYVFLSKKEKYALYVLKEYVFYVFLSKKEEYVAQGGLSVAGRCRCLTKDSNTSIEKEGYIPYSLQA